MGYQADYFRAHVSTWMNEGWLPSGGRIIEFGAQEFYSDEEETRSNVRMFLSDRGCPGTAIDEVLSSSPLSIAAIYRALGIDYTSIDVDGRYGSTYFDLNCFAPPLKWRGAFDLVNDEGTIEHLINPVNGFQVTHELLKVGGVAVHSMPLTGCTNHGIVYPTIKFYAYMIGANRYELLKSEITIEESELNFEDNRFLLRSSDQRRLDNGDLKLTDAWLHLTYRKTQAAEFRTPYDHLEVDQPSLLGEQLTANFSSYSRRRPTEDRPRDPIGDEYERQVEQQRREHEHQDILQKELQQREHEELRALQIDLQRAEHGHQQAIAELSTGGGFSSQLALGAILGAFALNGGGLLFDLLHPSRPQLLAFAAGLTLASLSSIFAWTDLLHRRRSPTARFLRHAVRLSWLVSIGLFIAGSQIVSP